MSVESIGQPKSHAQTPDELAAAIITNAAKFDEFITSLVRRAGDDQRQKIKEALTTLFSIDERDVHSIENVNIPSGQAMERFVSLLKRGFSTISNYLQEVERINDPKIIAAQQPLLDRLRGQILHVVSQYKSSSQTHIAQQIQRQTVFALTGKFPN